MNRKSLKKGEGALINTFFICILDMLKSRLTDHDLKYPTIADFLHVYGEKFGREPHKEKELLWQTANWAHVLFKMIKARTNAGLALEVLPKFVEGWHGKNDG